jgi:hypothetical protein
MLLSHDCTVGLRGIVFFSNTPFLIFLSYVQILEHVKWEISAAFNKIFWKKHICNLGKILSFCIYLFYFLLVSHCALDSRFQHILEHLSDFFSHSEHDSWETFKSSKFWTLCTVGSQKYFFVLNSQSNWILWRTLFVRILYIEIDKLTIFWGFLLYFTTLCIIAP